MDKAYDRSRTIRTRALRNDPTEAEKKLWLVIRNRQLRGVRFNRQVPVGCYICDFVSRSHKLIIEVDGGQHDWRAVQDARRTAILKAAGYQVVRFWNNDVLSNTEGVLQQILLALAGKR